MLSIPVQGHSPRSVDRWLGGEVLVRSFIAVSLMLAGPLWVQQPSPTSVLTALQWGVHLPRLCVSNCILVTHVSSFLSPSLTMSSLRADVICINTPNTEPSVWHRVSDLTKCRVIDKCAWVLENMLDTHSRQM